MWRRRWTHSVVSTGSNRSRSKNSMHGWLRFAGSGMAHVDALERHLDRMDEPTASKSPDRKKQQGPKREGKQ